MQAYVNKLWIILHYCQSNASQNTQLIGRVTEILWNIQNITQRRKYLLIQRFKSMIYWFYFHSVRDVLHALTVKNSIQLSNLFEDESLLYFEEGKNSVAFFIGKLPHRSLKKRVVFGDCMLEVLKPTKFITATFKTHCHPYGPTNFFTTQILSSNDQGGQRREGLRLRLPK